MAKRLAAATRATPATPTGPVDTSGPVEPDERVVRDPVTIRALAHPARLAVLEELSHGEQLTATECAELTGLSASAMSYHLRALQKYGFVERVETQGDGRERPWRSLATRWRTETAGDEDLDVATLALVEVSLQTMASEYAAWAAAEKDQPEPWRGTDFIGFSRVWMTPDEAAEVIETLEHLADRWRDRSRHDHPPDARRVRVAGFVLPSPD